ncbi:MAG: hypothetical protein V7776_04945 [Halopseudomonas aestusnigri]
MRYVVGGFMRSGTSMMMKCLEAGGLEALYSDETESLQGMRYRGGGYEPNVGGFYEGFGGEIGHGQVVKRLKRSPLLLNEKVYSVLIMRRESEEIRQSAQAIFNKDLPRGYGVQANKTMDEVESKLKTRSNIILFSLNYRDVVGNPIDAFTRLNWPIDIESAANVVDKTQCRYKKEYLDEGA